MLHSFRGLGLFGLAAARGSRGLGVGRGWGGHGLIIDVCALGEGDRLESALDMINLVEAQNGNDKGHDALLLVKDMDHVPLAPAAIWVDNGAEGVVGDFLLVDHATQIDDEIQILSTLMEEEEVLVVHALAHALDRS